MWKKDTVKVITISPAARKLVIFDAKIVCEDGKYGIKYLGDFYKLEPTNIFLDNSNKPTIMLNPLMVDIVHKLTDNQWYDKLMKQLSPGTNTR